MFLTSRRILSMLMALVLLVLSPLSVLASSLTIYSATPEASNLSNMSYVAAVTVNELGAFACLQGPKDSLLCLPKGETKPVMYSTSTVPEIPTDIDPGTIPQDQQEPIYFSSILAGSGEHLYGINPDSKVLYQVLLKEDGITLEKVTDLKDVSSLFSGNDPEYRYPSRQRAAYVQDGRFYFLGDGENWGEKAALTIFDMKTGEATHPQVDNLRFAAPYKNGDFLLVTSDGEFGLTEGGSYVQTYDFLLYHPDTGTTEPWTTVQNENIQGFTYLPEEDMTVIASDGQLFSVVPDEAIAQVGTYPPIQESSLFLQPYGHQVLMGASSYLGLRSVSKSFDPNTVLQVMGFRSFQTDQHFEAAQNMSVGHSAEYWMMDYALTTELITKGKTDVYTVQTQTDPTQALIQKGYWLDLSEDKELMDYVHSLHPLFQQEVLKDGKLIGIPIATSHTGVRIDSQVASSMNLNSKELPVSILSLMAFITKWNDQWTDQYPDMTPLLSFYGLRETMFQILLSTYIATLEHQGEPLRFDTEAFRKVMAGFEEMKTDNFPATNDQSVIYAGSYLYDQTQDNLFDTHFGQVGSEVILPLTKNYPPIYPINLEIMMINPNSAHREAAIAYLKSAIATLDNDHRYSLIASMDQPLENPDYKTRKAETEKWLANTKEMQAKAEDGKVQVDGRFSLEDIIASMEKDLERLEKEKFLVSREAIVTYRKLLKNGAFVSHQSSDRLFMDESLQLSQWMDNYLKGTISLDEFIQRMDQVLEMMEREN